MFTAEVIVSPELLRRLRQQRGFSIADLARRAGLTHGCVSRIEKGQRRARPATLRALAVALAVDPFALHPDSISEAA